MGSPNFAQSQYPTLGMTCDYDTSPEAIASYRADCLDADENDPEHPYYLCDETIEHRIWEDASDTIGDYGHDAETLADYINDWLGSSYAVNPFLNFDDSDAIPYTVKFETGYHDGFRLSISEAWFDNWNTPEKCYDNCIYWETIPKGMTFEQFKNCCEKVEAFCIYTMQQLAKDTPLSGISGGWCGGAYTLDDNTQADHDRFADEYNRMMTHIKNNHAFIWW